MSSTALTSPPNIRHLDLKGLTKWFNEKDEPAFRAKQVHEWLWKKAAHSFDDMSNLPKSTREALKSYFVIHAVRIDQSQVSKDGTIKNAFHLYDDKKVEGVLIPQGKR